MKKPLLIVVIILVVILAVPFVSLIGWTFQAKKPMGIIILDKTVPNLERINHRSLTWILTNDRFVKKNKSSYSYRKDYYGVFPTRPLKEKHWNENKLKLGDINEVTDNSDALYYADTYGLNYNNWFIGINNSRRPRRLVSGTNNSDYLYFVEMQRKNKLCILEYNTFDYPTAALERFKINERLGIEFKGWTGRYFSSLDTAAKSNADFPIWMTSMYRRAYRKPWNFTKPGIVLVSEKEIIVLEEGTHLKSALPLITTDSAYRAKYGITDNIAFEGSFDIIDPQRTKVISRFNLNTTEAGDTLLFEKFLTNSFPAVITDTINQRNYYFSGDFAANDIPYWTVRFNGVEKLKGLLYSKKEDDERRFFWLYYRPLVLGIFGDYYQSMKTK
jgi:hypothetical protein